MNNVDGDFAAIESWLNINRHSYDEDGFPTVTIQPMFQLKPDHDPTGQTWHAPQFMRFHDGIPCGELPSLCSQCLKKSQPTFPEDDQEVR